MPLTFIRIENANNRWICEAEFGGITAKRVPLRSDSFDDLLRQLSAAYHQHEGTDDPMAVQTLSPADMDRILYGRSFETPTGEHVSAHDVHIETGPVRMRSSAELYAQAGTTAETADADRNSPQEITQARAELQAQAAEQAPYGRKADGTPRKKPGRSAA